MARTKTRRSSIAPHRNQTPSKSPNQPPTPNQTKEGEGDGDGDGEDVVPLLTSAISLSLRFLNSNDLLLSPSQSLSLSSLLRSSALSLSSLLSPTQTHQPQFPNLPSPSITRAPTSNPFPWFRRFLSSSTSPSDPRWLETFRMSKPSFYLLLQTLSPSLSSLPSPSPLPADVKLSAALLRLAHAAPFPFIARRLGLPSPSLAAHAFYETLRAASDSLPHLFELSSDAPRVAQGFTWMSLPNCHGALAYSRFPVSPRGGSRSVLAQCLVDSECRFLDVSAWWDGSMAPADVLARTKLYDARSSVLSGGGGDEQLPRYFIGGSCCPLLPWLLTPSKESEVGRGSKEGVFNTVHARGMEMAGRALKRLRGRWRLLRTEWREECVGALPYVVVASCLLHNFLVKCSEPVVEDGEGEGSGGGVESGFGVFEGEADEEGERIRDVITTHLTKVIRK